MVEGSLGLCFIWFGLFPVEAQSCSRLSRPSLCYEDVWIYLQPVNLISSSKSGKDERSCLTHTYLNFKRLFFFYYFRKRFNVLKYEYGAKFLFWPNNPLYFKTMISICSHYQYSTKNTYCEAILLKSKASHGKHVIP